MSKQLIGHQDSAGRPIEVGSRVRFRGEEYTIKTFLYAGYTVRLEFEEELHTVEQPTEESVDVITGANRGTPFSAP